MVEPVASYWFQKFSLCKFFPIFGNGLLQVQHPIRPGLAWSLKLLAHLNPMSVFLAVVPKGDLLICPPAVRMCQPWRGNVAFYVAKWCRTTTSTIACIFQEIIPAIFAKVCSSAKTTGRPIWRSNMELALLLMTSGLLHRKRDLGGIPREAASRGQFTLLHRCFLSVFVNLVITSGTEDNILCSYQYF